MFLNPFLCGISTLSGSSPQASINAFNASTCFSFKFLGISTTTFTYWSPLPEPFTLGTPFPFNLKSVPDYIPAGTVYLTSPSTVGTVISHPSAALDIDIWVSI